MVDPNIIPYNVLIASPPFPTVWAFTIGKTGLADTLSHIYSRPSGLISVLEISVRMIWPRNRLIAYKYNLHIVRPPFPMSQYPNQIPYIGNGGLTKYTLYGTVHRIARENVSTSRAVQEVHCAAVLVQ